MQDVSGPKSEVNEYQTRLESSIQQRVPGNNTKANDRSKSRIQGGQFIDW